MVDPLGNKDELLDGAIPTFKCVYKKEKETLNVQCGSTQ